ncbi:MAG: heme exporter protein CcmB [Chloroflexi bacterium]|nr:heme exporter protein CcmB [Chloroflexota bacterium]
MDFVNKALAIVWKDVVVELRTKESLTSMFVFALLTIVIFNFAFELRAENTGLLAPGVLWVSFTFAGVLGLTRSFIREKDRGCLEGLMLCPVDRSAIYVGKALGNLVFMLIMEAIALPLFVVFFNLPVLVPSLLLVILLGTVGFAVVGTLFSAISVNTKAREVMLPILFFPIVVPVVIAAVKSTVLVFDGNPLTQIAGWLNLMVVFDAIFLVLSYLSFEFILEE